ncbi:MAG: hypothetical protein ACI4E1_00910 [Lachnospira sp.]
MNGINSYNSSFVSSLFSNMGNKTSSGSLFSGIDLNTYSSIRNGSYRSLLKSYYSQDTGNKASSTYSAKQTTTAATKVNATATRDAAKALIEDVSELNKSSLWDKKTITDKDGNKSTDYDRDAIYKAASAYVKDYNSLIGLTADSEDDATLRAASNFITYTNRNSSLLKSIGVSIGTDNKLSIDEEAFKAADISQVKSVFGNGGALTGRASVAASNIYSSSASVLSKLATTNTYTASGSYSYVSGSVFNSFT